jgi:integrase
MGINVQARPGGRHQLRVRHALLPRPFFFTFATPEEANTYGAQLWALLSQGVVPSDLVAPQTSAPTPLLVEVIRAFTKAAPITTSDEALLGTMLEELVGVRVGGVTFAWADGYVQKLKARQLAPGTIRKRVGALARVIDWHLRRATPAGQLPPANTLRMLPVGYSVYTRAEAAALQAKDVDVPRDVERDRRYMPGEEARVLAALQGQKRPDRERALQLDADFLLLYLLIVHTGMRLLEAYRLRSDQVDLQRSVINVEGSKGHRGKIKPRVVPIVPALDAPLARHLQRRPPGLLFRFWNGTPEDLRPCTNRLSARFAKLFDYAGVTDMTEHDLRHEATCRWVLMRRPSGSWAFSDIEICRIMGWKDPRLMVRYASLRGEDLSARLR